MTSQELLNRAISNLNEKAESEAVQDVDSILAEIVQNQQVITKATENITELKKKLGEITVTEHSVQSLGL